MNDQTEFIWEAPKIEPPEFRLYHDAAGKVICYTCEKLEGTYVVIDALTFALARPDVIVLDGVVTAAKPPAMVCKLIPSNEGITCASEDISIIVNHTHEGKTIKWNLTVYEL